MDRPHHVIAAAQPVFGHGGTAEFIILGLPFPAFVAIDQLRDGNAVLVRNIRKQAHFVTVPQFGRQFGDKRVKSRARPVKPQGRIGVEPRPAGKTNILHALFGFGNALRHGAA